MGSACQYKEKEKIVTIIDIKNGKISWLELGTPQLKFFYSYDKEDDKIVVYMSLPSDTHKRELVAVMPNDASVLVERVISRFLSPPAAPEVVKYVEKITTNIAKQAKIKIGDDDSEEKLLDGLVASFGYKYEYEKGKYYVYAEASGIYEEEKYLCHAHEHDYVNEDEVKTCLINFAQNVVAIASTCTTN